MCQQQSLMPPLGNGHGMQIGALFGEQSPPLAAQYVCTYSCIKCRWHNSELQLQNEHYSVETTVIGVICYNQLQGMFILYMCTHDLLYLIQTDQSNMACM